jgi:hypothetical protein
MQPWVLKSMQRWPNVPALFGWLGLNRRGRWLIQGEAISHPRIVETINRNYGVDEHGRWFFQNGPQRGYIELAYAPFVLRREHERFVTHNGLAVERASQAVLDESGSLSLVTEHGLGEVEGGDLEWALEHSSIDGRPLDETQLMTLLELPSQTNTNAVLALGAEQLPIIKIDTLDLPQLFNFVRTPAPMSGESVSTKAPD